MAVRQKQGGPIKKWDIDAHESARKIPFLLVAKFIGVREIPSGFGGNVVDLGIWDGKQITGSETWSCPAMLFSLLQGTEPGMPITIAYHGKAKNATNDNISHQFKVWEMDRMSDVVPDADIPF